MTSACEYRLTFYNAAPYKIYKKLNSNAESGQGDLGMIKY